MQVHPPTTFAFPSVFNLLLRWASPEEAKVCAELASSLLTELDLLLVDVLQPGVAQRLPHTPHIVMHHVSNAKEQLFRIKIRIQLRLFKSSGSGTNYFKHIRKLYENA